MAKRFTDTDLWDKEWFMLLTPMQKCLVKYVRDKSNVAGIWHPNYKLASTYIGETVTEEDLLAIDSGRQFLKLDCKKIFCIGFIKFQYGATLNEKSPVHKKIVDILKVHFVNSNTLYDTLFNTLLDSPQEEDKEKEKEEEVEVVEENPAPKVSLKTYAIPKHVLETAELNQFTLYKQKNTEFILENWKIFIQERTLDPPSKIKTYNDEPTELQQYFLNWMRTKKPSHGNSKTLNGSSGKSAGAEQLLASLKQKYAS